MHTAAEAYYDPEMVSAKKRGRPAKRRRPIHLLLFLNSVEFGQSTYDVTAASKRFFDRASRFCIGWIEWGAGCACRCEPEGLSGLGGHPGWWRLQGAGHSLINGLDIIFHVKIYQLTRDRKTALWIN